MVNSWLVEIYLRAKPVLMISLRNVLSLTTSSVLPLRVREMIKGFYECKVMGLVPAFEESKIQAHKGTAILMN
jgi:hypothetical protein